MKTEYERKKLSLEQRKLAEAHIPDALLAVKSCKEVATGQIEFEEAVAEGYLTLSRCACTYIDMGYEFSTYVSSCIKWRMKELARNKLRKPVVFVDKVPEEGLPDASFADIEMTELIDELEDRFPPPFEEGMISYLLDGRSLVDIQRKHPEIHYDKLRRYKKKIKGYLDENMAWFEK